jgi:hypothetical protein
MFLFVAGVAIGILGSAVFRSSAVRDALNLLLIALRPKPERHRSEVIAERPTVKRPRMKSTGAALGR